MGQVMGAKLGGPVDTCKFLDLIKFDISLYIFLIIKDLQNVEFA